MNQPSPSPVVHLEPHTGNLVRACGFYSYDWLRSTEGTARFSRRAESIAPGERGAGCFVDRKNVQEAT